MWEDTGQRKSFEPHILYDSPGPQQFSKFPHFFLQAAM